MRVVLMLSVIVGIPIISSQIQPHMDLEKVGEAIFDNEQYNVLKPTIHVIKDHFKDHMLGKERKMNRNEKIYLDESGFRHIWYGRKAANIKSLRKADITDLTIEIQNNDNNDTTKPNNESALRSTLSGSLKRNKNGLKLAEDKKIINKAAETTTVKGKDVLRNKTNSQTLVKATFYCPFIGIIKMATVI